MLDKIYHALLWFCGFKTEEHVSDMLARQKQRLGGWWWAFPIVTLFSTIGLWVFKFVETRKLEKNRVGRWWWVTPIFTSIGITALFVFEIWLLIHIVTFRHVED